MSGKMKSDAKMTDKTGADQKSAPVLLHPASWLFLVQPPDFVCRGRILCKAVWPLYRDVLSTPTQIDADSADFAEALDKESDSARGVVRKEPPPCVPEAGPRSRPLVGVGVSVERFCAIREIRGHLRQIFSERPGREDYALYREDSSLRWE